MATRDLARKAFLFTVGAVVLAKEEGEAIVGRLIERGERIHRSWFRVTAGPVSDEKDAVEDESGADG